MDEEHIYDLLGEIVELISNITSYLENVDCDGLDDEEKEKLYDDLEQAWHHISDATETLGV